MNKLLLSILISISAFSVKAQKIDITLGKYANQKFAFSLNKGIKKDTIASGQLNFAGNTTISIPAEDKNYIGVASLEIANGESIPLIINKESFSIFQSEDETSFNFKGSAENEYLFNVIKGKEGLAMDTALYAHTYIQLIQYMSQLNRAVYQGASMMDKASLKVYAYKDLNMEKLYTSGVWQIVIDDLMKLSSSENSFGNEMIKIINKTKSVEVLEHLVSNLITITMQFGWEEAFGAIITHVKESGRIQTPRGDIFDAFLAVNVMKGSQAPSIVGLSKKSDYSYTRTLVIFYQPDCLICEGTLSELIGKYNHYKDEKVRIISISSDDDRSNFENDCKRFPWPDKLCDFEGMLGKNFTNYGILGTPTLFLIDDSNIIQKRFAKLDDIQL